MLGVGEPLRMVTCTQVSLIDPLEVHVEVPPVHVAEPVLTPIGRSFSVRYSLTISLRFEGNTFRINYSRMWL